MMLKKITKKRNVNAKGEPYVWLTAMGLTIGLAMVAGLLGLILVNGLRAFWPDRVALIELSESSTQREKKWAGSIKKEQVIKDLTAKVSSEPKHEIQTFSGNKEVFGHSYIYFDKADIESVTYPSGLLRIERLEYGDALGYPLRVVIDERTVEAEAPEFNAYLQEQVLLHAGQWKQIRKIERNEMDRVRLLLERLEKKAKKRDTALTEVDRVKKQNLEIQLVALGAEARALRDLQTKDFFYYKLANGSEQRLEVGKIVSFYYPNRLSWFRKLGVFLHEIFIFISQDPREANTEGGVFPAIFGTFVMTLLMSLMVTPVGVLGAIYLHEYAKPGLVVRMVRIAVNNLAGVPSIVFGVFGLGFFVYFMGGSIDKIFFSDSLPTPTFGTGGILWASLTLALLTAPVVIVATEEALSAVPQGMRMGSFACGASQWQTVYRIVLPASLPGIMTGVVLAMARGASEVAPLMIVGVVKLAPNLPLDWVSPFMHFERKFMHLGFHIYDLGFQSPDSEAAKPIVFATTLLLILIVITLNLAAIIVRERLRRRYVVASF